MQYETLQFLKCPITHTDLRFELISEFKKTYTSGDKMEVREGVLFSETGFIFPIIDGIPRMLVESICDYSEFLKKHVKDYSSHVSKVEKDYKGILDYCVNKNKRTKQSFEFEWSFLDAEKRDKIWHEDLSQLKQVFLKETAQDEDYYKGKTVIDVGSGHGVMTSKIAEISKLAIGVELGKAVESAYKNNNVDNAWYVQADLQFLPFDRNTFDVLYSSGVIHHTDNTELSLSLIEYVLREKGNICLWLYHPFKSIIHNLILKIRFFTRKMPVKLTFVLLLLFVFPFTFMIKLIKRRKAPNYREEIIDLLDGFTPEFRYEIPQDVAITWLQRRNYSNVNVTTSNQFGYSVTGIKQG